MTFYLTCDNGYGKIHSVVGSSCVGTTENETVWWNNFSDYFTVAANKTLTLNFKNYSSKSENWNNRTAQNDCCIGINSYGQRL